MDQTIKVSIITVTYNVEKTIEQTINSVLNQTYSNIEYIIVDGMSTDETWERICKYKDHISVLVHEPDAGLYDAMNKGIALATGDIIGIINGDDWYEVHTVSKVVEEMTQDVDIIYANMNMIQEDGRICVTHINSMENIWYQMVAHPTVFVRRGMYQTLGLFDLQYYIASDYELLLRFCVNGARCKYVNEIFANFRVGGISTKRELESVEEVRKISMKYIHRCPQRERYIELIQKRYKEVKARALYNMGSRDFVKMLDAKFILAERNICIWGAGYWGRRLAKKMSEANIHIECFIDNNKLKQGEKIEELEVFSAERLSKGNWNVIIAILNGYEAVLEELKRLNNPDLTAQWFLDLNTIIMQKESGENE